MAIPKVYLGIIGVTYEGEEGLSSTQVQLSDPPLKRVRTGADAETLFTWHEEQCKTIESICKTALLAAGYTFIEKKTHSSK